MRRRPASHWGCQIRLKHHSGEFGSWRLASRITHPPGEQASQQFTASLPALLGAFCTVHHSVSGQQTEIFLFFLALEPPK